VARISTERPVYLVQVIERAVDTLQVLSEDSRELGAGELGERLSLHKSTVHRLLSVLDQHRLIRRNAETGRYTLGLRLPGRTANANFNSRRNTCSDAYSTSTGRL
jgi:IclR family transcriptional regulator, KDG regulon repressor